MFLIHYYVTILALFYWKYDVQKLYKFMQINLIDFQSNLPNIKAHLS